MKPITQSKSEQYQKVLVVILLFLLSFLICMLSPLSPIGYTGLTSTDSSVYKYIGWMMSEGYVPYKDFFEHKGFILYFLNYLGIVLSYDSGIWFVELTFMFLSTSFIYIIARKFNNRFNSLFVTILTITPLYLYFTEGNLSEEYALPFEIISLYIFIDYFLDPEKYEKSQPQKALKLLNARVILCGGCFASVFFIRANMCSLWIIFCAIIFIQCIQKRKLQLLGKFVLSFIIGILIVSLPIIIYLAMNNALNAFLSDYLYFSKLYISHETRASSINKATSFYTFLNNTACILAFIIIFATIASKKKEQKNILFDCGYLLYMIVNLIFVSISGQTFMHYGMTLIPMYIYPYSVMCRFYSSEKFKDYKLNIIVIGYLSLSLIIPNWLNICKTTTTKILTGDSIYTNNVIEYIKNNTTAEETISVYGNKNIIYNLSKRSSASRYSYQAPIGTVVNPAIMDEYFEDLQEELPAIIIWQTDRISGGPLADKMNSFLEQNGYILVIDDTLALYERANNET